MKLIIFNKTNRFLLSTFLIMFLVQFIPVLRVPLMGLYLGLFFILKLHKIKFDFISFLFFLLFIYFVFQNILLGDKVGLLDFFQSVLLIFLYLFFYSITKGEVVNIKKIKLKEVSIFLVFLIPCFGLSVSEWNYMRIAGILGNPNITGHTLLLLFPFAFLVKPTRKFLYIILGITGFIVVLLASRSAMLSLVLGFGGYLLSLKKNRSKLFLFSYAILSLVISYSAVDIAIFILKTYLTTFTIKDSRLFYAGYNGRDKILEMAMTRFHNGSELLGLGFTNVKFEDHGHVLSAHNGFLELLLRSGYIGIFLYALILLVFLFKIIKIEDIQKRSACLMSFVIILSLSTNSSTFFVFNFIFFYFMYIFNISVSNTIDYEG